MKMKTLGRMLSSTVFAAALTTALNQNSFAQNGPLADYGDISDTYQTTYTNNGPYHLNGSYEWLGNGLTYESNAVINPITGKLDGGGDVNDDGLTFVGTVNAEGGVLYTNVYYGGQLGEVLIKVSVADWNSGRYDASHLLYLDGWIDWTHDGDFYDSGTINGQAWSEHVVSLTLNPFTWGQNSIILTETFLNGTGQDGLINTRWRLSYVQGINDIGGEKDFGEVEDYGPGTIDDGSPSQIPVPEPSALVLCALGIAGLCFHRRLFKA